MSKVVKMKLGSLMLVPPVAIKITDVHRGVRLSSLKTLGLVNKFLVGFFIPVFKNGQEVHSNREKKHDVSQHTDDDAPLDQTRRVIRWRHLEQCT